MELSNVNLKDISDKFIYWRQLLDGLTFELFDSEKVRILHSLSNELKKLASALEQIPFPEK
jgi:hypothetical protein